MVTPPLGSPSSARSPSPLTSILENTVSVNSSAVMAVSLQGLMARMAWEEEGAEVRGAHPYPISGVGVGTVRACAAPKSNEE